jgi:hypothetical protein
MTKVPGNHDHYDAGTRQKTYGQLLGRTLPHVIRTEENVSA